MSHELIANTPLKNASERLQHQIQFILEIDKLKTILRRTNLIDNSRHENDAEHSWHLAMMAVVLADHAAPDVNIFRVIKMVLVHDLVEIDAGDTFAYDDSPHAATKNAREYAAANRLYGLLPKDIGAELMGLWEEFEVGETADAKFAIALDRMHPLLLNYFSGGGAWSKHNITKDKVIARQCVIGDASKSLWEMVEAIINDAVEREYLKA